LWKSGLKVRVQNTSTGLVDTKGESTEGKEKKKGKGGKLRVGGEGVSKATILSENSKGVKPDTGMTWKEGRSRGQKGSVRRNPKVSLEKATPKTKGGGNGGGEKRWTGGVKIGNPAEAKTWV